MPKFFIDKPYIHENTIEILGDDAKHIVNVLRCVVGEKLVFCDNEGFDYYCEIKEFNDIKKSVVAKINETKKCENEPETKVTLFQGLPKSDKMELIIQKAVELGVNEVVGVSTSRTIVKLDNKEKKKIDRWQKISESAAKQSFRGIIPEINKKIFTFTEAIKESKNYDLAIIPYENEYDTTLKKVLKSEDYSGKKIAVFIGPEGGFSVEEVNLAIENNVKTVTLGERILRTETAAITTISSIIYELEQ